MFEFWHDFLTDSNTFLSTIFITAIMLGFFWWIYKMAKEYN